MSKNNEIGRTMLEMIGVLGLIGILSVSGLGLYAKAMNTIKANYLMQQVFIKANEEDSTRHNSVARRHKSVDLGVSSGDSLSYGYSFDSVTIDAKTRMISITINSDPHFTAGVCQILKKKLKAQEYGGLEDIRSTKGSLEKETCSADTSSLVFIIDSKFKKQEVVHVEVVPGGKEEKIVIKNVEKTDEEKCEEDGGTWCVPGDGLNYCAPAGENCCTAVPVGECKTCDTNTGEQTGDITKNTNFCTYIVGDAKSGRCRYDGECVSAYCLKNDECGPGKYCEVVGSKVEAHSYITGGTCESIGGYTDFTIEGIGTVRISTNIMKSWWAANNWCKANGKEGVAPEAFQCYDKEGKSLTVSGVCCAKGKACGNVDSFRNYWSSHNIIRDEALVNEYFSPVAISWMKNQKFGDSHVWTSGTNGSSCYYAYAGGVQGTGCAAKTRGYALCQ